MKDKCVTQVLMVLLGILVCSIAVQFVVWLVDVNSYNQRVTRMGCVGKQSTFAHVMAKRRKRKYDKKKVALSESSSQSSPWSNFVSSFGTSEQFAERLKSPQNSLVFIHADWCGVCQTQKPTFNAIAEDLMANKVTPIEVNSAVLTQEQLQSMGVDAFPFFALCGGGKFIKGEAGYKTPEEILAYVK